MPIYEYRCTSCGHELEVMQKIVDPAPAKCPKCEAEATLERLVSRTSFQLKGGGWYNDLYSSVKKEPSKDGASASPAAPAASPSTTSAPSAAASTPSSAPASSGGGSSSGGGGSGSSSGGGS